ncbi:MAG: hypothetical protein HQL27_01410 [Candidatus Omnitrophica bacterium]|nr:hypothetical protein [Candidatus Omnitrophota bacterium]
MRNKKLFLGTGIAVLTAAVWVVCGRPACAQSALPGVTSKNTKPPAASIKSKPAAGVAKTVRQEKGYVKERQKKERELNLQTTAARKALREAEAKGDAQAREEAIKKLDAIKEQRSVLFNDPGTNAGGVRPAAGGLKSGGKQPSKKLKP